MFARQWEAGLGMIEVLAVDAGSLPVDGGVTTSAFRSESPLMLVFVACDAAGREAHPGAV